MERLKVASWAQLPARRTLPIDALSVTALEAATLLVECNEKIYVLMPAFYNNDLSSDSKCLLILVHVA